MEDRISANHDTGDISPIGEWIKGISSTLMPFA